MSLQGPDQSDRDMATLMLSVQSMRGARMLAFRSQLELPVVIREASDSPVHPDDEETMIDLRFDESDAAPTRELTLRDYAEALKSLDQMALYCARSRPQGSFRS